MLDLESLQRKMVRARRGGYCFKHNLLLKAALDTLRFHATPLGASSRSGFSYHIARGQDVDRILAGLIGTSERDRVEVN
ncbi:MAG: hypothetical protein OJF51_001411 [Nitrospira sp.]|nr:MAG: hypothetical protein OJF51_001411 [Nitrospira sp.]